METQPEKPNHTGKYEQYIVRDEVWQAAGMPLGSVDKNNVLRGGGGCLCVGCIERRLRRPLTIGDFRTETIWLLLERRAAGWFTPRLAARVVDPIDAALYARPAQMILESDGLMYHGEIAEGTDTAIWEPESA
jgi:hypothetical protein